MITIKKSYRLALRSILIALVIIQTTIPFLGYIPLIFVNITFIQITVITATCLLGLKDGLLVAITWGLCKLCIAYTTPQSLMDTLVFQNVFVTIIPKLCIASVAYLIYTLIYRKSNKFWISCCAAGISGSITNTVITLTLMTILEKNSLLNVYHASNHDLNHILLSIITINGIPEMIVSAILTPIIVKALRPYIKKV